MLKIAEIALVISFNSVNDALEEVISILYYSRTSYLVLNNSVTTALMIKLINSETIPIVCDQICRK